MQFVEFVLNAKGRTTFQLPFRKFPVLTKVLETLETLPGLYVKTVKYVGEKCG